MITAYGDEQTRQTAIRNGAVGFLTKPLDFGILRQELAKRLSSVEAVSSR
jgi:response regulator of citrate/malate metabolism